MFAVIPLLAIVVGPYHLVVLTGSGSLGAGWFSATLLSGATFTLSTGDVLMAVGLILLFFETFKATRSSSLSIVDHLLSMLLVILCVVEFIVLPGLGTTIFLMLALMTFIDVVADFTVTNSTARRTIGLEDGLRR